MSILLYISGSTWARLGRGPAAGADEQAGRQAEEDEHGAHPDGGRRPRAQSA